MFKYLFAQLARFLGIAVGDRMFLGMQDFAQIQSILPSQTNFLQQFFC